MNTLVIAEKPSVALRLAIAIGNNTQKRLIMNGVSYYEIPDSADTIYIAAAVGHLYTIKQADSKRGYPVLDVEWAPSSDVDKGAYFTKKYLDVFKFLAPKCNSFINACDFDIEGTVIGTNILRFMDKLDKNAKRMKFSTTTIPDLQNSYSDLLPIDIFNFYAGETRHVLDWLWGINLSRALSSALSGSRFARSLSIGRVQGPTLSLLAKRETEIAGFVSKPFWRLIAIISDVEFTNARGDIFQKEVATKSLEATNANSKNAFVDRVESKEQFLRPYPPFDLTALQLEASRTLRLDPTTTLAIAQSLYEKSYISYPRTSSQKLPPTLGLSRIIGELAKNPNYETIAKRLIEKRLFKPNEGFKTDEAHPAIYPTGVMPKQLAEAEGKLYDLITKRFLAAFAPYAKLLKMSVEVKIGDERYLVNGSRILERGWLDFYGYAQLSEKILPEFKQGSRVDVSKTSMQELKTQPPRRYSKAMLIAELEKRELGTKATRASIIDTLFKRGYIDGTIIKVTNFGMSVYGALNQNASMILDEETTRKLEEDMGKISKGQVSAEEVVEEGKAMLLEALKAFDKNKSEIGKAMEKGLVDSEEVIGKCIVDGGNLVIKRSRAGKTFVACSNYPNCTNTYSIPQYAKIVPTGKVCEHCHTPIVKVIRRAKGVFEMDLDPNCITKKEWRERREVKAVEAAVAEIEAKQTKPKAKKARKTTRKRTKKEPKVV